MVINVKQNMNSQEIKEWRKGNAFIPFKGVHKYKNWVLVIRVDNLFKYVDIRVIGYNGILFGKFELDNGWNTGDSYYPAMTFYNKLSLSECMGWACSDTLCSYVDFGKDDMCELTLDKIFCAVEESWGKIKEFLS